MCGYPSIWKNAGLNIAADKNLAAQALTMLLSSLTGDLGDFTTPHQNVEQL